MSTRRAVIRAAIKNNCYICIVERLKRVWWRKQDGGANNII